MKVLLVSATYLEISIFVERLKLKVVQNNFYSGNLNSMKIDCLIAGIGSVATTYHLTRHISDKNYDTLINTGIAGTYNDDLYIGQVVEVISDCFADMGIDNNGVYKTLFEENLQDPNEFPFKHGKLINLSPVASFINLPKIQGITVNTVTGSMERIQYLYNKFKPDVETMEGAAFAYICLMNSIPYAQVRAVSNRIEPRNKKNWDISNAIKNLNSTLIDIFTSRKWEN